MIVLIVFLLACYGVTNIITSGQIFGWLRKLLKPVPVIGCWIHCPMCVGVPVGIVWCWLGLWPELGLEWWKQWAAAGAVSSAWCWMVRVHLHSRGEDSL